MRKPLIMLMSLSVMCLLPMVGMAVPTLGQMWENDSADWDARLAPSSDPATTPTAVWTSGAGEHAVELNFSDGGPTVAGQVYTTGADFIGDYTGIAPEQLMINFTLTSPDVAANPYGGLAIYFKIADGSIWYASVNPEQTTGAYNYSVFIGNESAWAKSLDYASQNDWFTDFAHVTEFGFEVLGGNLLGEQRYQFNDINFTVPEPETIWVIMMVLASMAITFRGRIGEFVSQVKSRFTV